MKYAKFIVFITILCFNACKVDRFPETQISDPLYWQNESDLIAATNYLYTFLPHLPVNLDAMSDDAFSSLGNDVSTGARIAPPQSVDYSEPYKLIRAANSIIEKAPRAIDKGTKKEIVDKYIAEARFFRAWAYFQLVQKYGDVPLILNVLPDNAPELKAAAAPREKVYDAIYEDLDYASQTLPTPTQLAEAKFGRISKTASLAFKARVALFEGTRSKYHNYGNPSKHLTFAVAAAQSVIDSKEHSLYGNYFNLFQPAGEGRQNRENVLVRRYGNSTSDIIVNHQGNLFAALGQGHFSPTKALADSYLMKDGLPINKSPLYKKPTSTVEVFTNRDLRMGATIFKKGDPYVVLNGQTALFNIAELGFVRTGFHQRKFFNSLDYGAAASFTDLPIIRYAEVLLILAEAKYELSGSITDQDLNSSVNLLRTRAGLPALTNSFVTNNGLNMREEIRRERRIELAQEGFRYWDIIRWKIAEVELPKPVLGSFFFVNEWGTTVAVNLTPDNYIIAQAASFRKFNPQRDYLWPFPVAELALNPALKQNPGW